MPDDISNVTSVRLSLNAYLNDLKTSAKRKALPNFNEEILEGSFVEKSSEKVKDSVVLSLAANTDDEKINFNAGLTKQASQLEEADVFLYRKSGNFIKSHQKSGSLLDLYV